MGLFGHLFSRLSFLFSFSLSLGDDPLLEKLSLAHGLRQLTRDTKSDVSCLQTSLTHLIKDLQVTFGVGRHTTLIVIFFLKASIFQRIGKKNQMSVSDADQEIPVLGSTDNAGNSVNLHGFLHLPFTSGWDFSVCIGPMNDRFYFS